MNGHVDIYSSTLPVDFVKNLAGWNMKMFSKMDTNEIYKAIIDTSFDVIKKVKVGLLFILSQDNGKLELVSKKGIKANDVKMKAVETGRGIIAELIKTGTKQYQTGAIPLSEFISKDALLKKRIHTSIYVPLKAVGKVFGVLNLYLNKPNQFTPAEEVMLDILGGHAAVAIQNVKLFKGVQHSYDDLDFVNKILKDITSTLDLNKVLKNILRASQQIADAETSFLWYKDITTKKWKRTFPENFKKEGCGFPEIENGEGIIGRVLTTGKNYLCNDVTIDPYYFNTWKGIKSELAIPLIIDGDVKGILDVESSKYNAFIERHVQLLTMLADQAAIALRNAQLYEIAERSTRQFITLTEIAEALSHQKSLKDILDIIARESLNLVGIGKKVCFVMLIDKEKNMLETKAAYGELVSKDYFDFHIPLSQRSIVTWVVRNRKPRIVADVSKDDDYYKITDETRSEICIPLFFRDEVIGVIDIESSDLNAFDYQDAELLRTLADNTAIGTKIAELCDIRLKQLEALYKTGTKITSSLNLDEVLNTIAREALNAIGPQRRILFVQLLDESDQSLEIKVAKGVEMKRQFVGTRHSITDGISGWVVKNRTHYLCTNIKNDPHYYPWDPNVKSELCVPIFLGERVIGLINVESLDANDFGQYEVQWLQQLANQAGIAIENARLNEELAETQFQLTEALGVTVVSEALAGLTHDIRTASSLISGEAQWIEYLHEKENLQFNDVTDAMKKIESHVARIEAMTNDLMEKAQQLPPEFSTTNLSDLTRSSVYLTSGYARRQNVEIDVNYSSLQFIANVDIRRIKRVFLNLIKNAIEAMPNGGKLCIWAKQFEKHFDIFFSDEGEGIGSEDLKKIWTPFFSLKRGGSGLGLPNCKRIIETDHNGKINIKSSKGRGTAIRIRLPYKQ